MRFLSLPDEVFTTGTKTPIRVLIVADGIITFKEKEFGLTELCKALQASATPWEDLVITTAHRAPASVDMGAQIPGFKFDAAPKSPFLPFTKDNYEQVWLFGYLGQDGSPLGKGELKRIDDFMDAGGGVFATGDHKDLGFAMCNQVPRVGSMRKWYFHPVPAGKFKAPDQDGPTRLDTLRQGRDAGFQFSDQSDDVPQEIRPRFFLNPDGKGSHPHPLLAFGDFAVTVLPDHMHEGECIIPSPTELAENTYSFDDEEDPKPEFPEFFDMPARLSPEMAAISTSAGGYLTDEDDVFPVEPRCFGIIVAYDGHLVDRLVGGDRVKLGRVVVDASFHHFVDTNLKGTDSIDPTKKGFYDANGNPTKDYVAIKQYYRNIVTWLCPPEVHIHYYLNLLLALRFLSPLIEELSSMREVTFRDILFAGTVTRKAIAERFSSAEAVLCALAVSSLSPTKHPRIAEFINPWQPSARRCEKINVLSDAQVFIKTVLGSAVIGLAKEFPESPVETTRARDKKYSHVEMLRPAVINGLNQGFNLLTEVLDDSIATFRKLKETLVRA